MYRLYLKQNGEQLLLPVTPAEIETRTGNQNKTAYILDFGEMNLAKKPGLTEIRFTALLPGRAYSFVQTEGGFREPEYFLNRFKEYKASAKPVQMILFRRLADGKQKFCGNTEVLLEEYTVTEKGGEQGDFWVEFFWKEWRAAKSIRYSIQGNSMMAQGQARQAKQPAAEPPAAQQAEKKQPGKPRAKKEKQADVPPAGQAPMYDYDEDRPDAPAHSGDAMFGNYKGITFED